MGTKRKRIVVSLETKLQAIRRLDNGETIKKVAADLGVGVVTVGDWRRNRAEIEKWCSQAIGGSTEKLSRKTMKKCEFEKTSEALFLWFMQMRRKGNPISGPMLQVKALEFHKQLHDGEEEFTASAGWLDRWKKRYGVRHLNSREDTLSIEPLCQGVSEKFPKSYKHQLLESLVKSLEEDKGIAGCLKKITLQDIISLVAEILENIKPSTLIKSWVRLLNVEKEKEESMERDKNEEITELTNDVIVNIVNQQHKDKDGKSEQGNEIPHLEGLRAIELVIRYIGEQEEVTPADLLVLRRWHSIAMVKQASIIKQERIAELNK